MRRLWRKGRDGLVAVVDGVTLNRGRSVLTALGIAMVTAASIAGVSLGRTSQAAVARDFQNVSSGYISVWPADGSVRALSRVEVEAGSAAPGVVATAAAAKEVADVTTRGDSQDPPKQLTVWAVEGDFPTATGLRLSSGQWFDRGHYARGDTVAIVGSLAARTLGVARVDGAATIRIDGQTYLIMGIADAAPGDPALLTGVIVPAGSRQPDSDQVDIAYAVAEPLGVAGAAQRFVASMRPNDFARFTVNFDLADLRLGSSVVAEVGALTAGILAIGSLVGVVVVGALATASVTERRREIAVRKALGATSVGIGARFVGEAAFIGVVGSSMGVYLGQTMILIAASVRDGQPILDSSIVWLAIGQGIAASVVGASLPALRAARFDPAETLSRA